MLECLSDKSVSNRETVLSLLRKLELTDVELDKITNLLSLKTSSIRQTVIKILLEQDDSNLENIASSLIKSSNSQKCLGGLEIVNLLKDNTARQELYNKLVLLIEDIDKSKKNTSQVQILIDNLLGKAKMITAKKMVLEYITLKTKFKFQNNLILKMILIAHQSLIKLSQI